jgi:CHASE3 domain sensor protein
MIRNLKIRPKLLASFTLIVFFVGLVGAMGIYGTQQIIRAFNVIVNGSAPALHALLEIKSTANEMEAETMSFELLGLESTVSEGTSASDKEFRDYWKRWRNSRCGRRGIGAIDPAIPKPIKAIFGPFRSGKITLWSPPWI